jgi:threonyl-tRNA synthetase
MLCSALPSDATISCYRCGPMVDLCHGPHVPNTGLLKVSPRWFGNVYTGVQCAREVLPELLVV